MYKQLNRLLLTVSVFILSACMSSQTLQSSDHSADTVSVYLVRHAEKTKKGADPDLTQAGKERSLELAKLLKNENINHVHSSDYLRTRETANPTATLFNLEIDMYDPGDLPAMAKKLKASSGVHLVVGHSNTTPQLVDLLGGDPVSEIDEASEYDRLYKVTLQNGAVLSSELMRYGRLYQ